MNALASPPSWGLALGSYGSLAVVFGIVAFVCAAVAWLVGARPKQGAVLFWVGAGCVVAAMGFHIALLLTKQYEFQYVRQNTRDAMPWIYRLSGAWAGQEGSFLLWVTTSAVIAALAARSTGIYRRWYTIICSCALAAMLGIVAYESPFKLIELDPTFRASLPAGQSMVMPPDGLGLNPVLQNYWMVIHPWVIFTGFGSLLALFGWSVSAAFSKDWKTWALAARPWAVFSATILGLGLTMGGLWAYETLGWGGFWAWDPVENVSLVPFIAASVLIHTLYVQATRARWMRWNLILGALPFMWFAYGTYLTRSGALVNVSVHSFARMADGAHRLLLGLVLSVASLVLVVAAIAVRRRAMAEETSQASGHRSLAMGWGMAALYLVAIFAAVGMSVPFLAAVFGHAPAQAMRDPANATASEQLYNRIVLWPFVPALLLMGIAPLLGWTKTLAANFSRAAVILYVCFFLSITGGLTLMWTRTMQVSPWVMLALVLSVWACISSVVSNTGLIIQRRKNLGSVSAFVMHAGVSLLLLGLIVSHACEKTSIAAITSDTSAKLDAGPLDYEVAMTRKPTGEELLTPENTLSLILVDGRGRHLDMKPTVFYKNELESDSDEPMMIARPSIKRSLLYDTYLSVTARETEMAPGPISLALNQPVEAKLGTMVGDVPVKLTYVKRKLTGGMGLPGSKFATEVLIEVDGQTVSVTPEIEIAKDGIEHRDVLVGHFFGVRLEALGAETGEATISFLYPEAVYQVELFFKPLTILVWLGAGLMTLGGALTVFRLSRKAPT